MYTTTDLVEIVKRNITDYYNNASVVGEFWNTAEILLVLNAVQDQVVNFLLTNKQYTHLRHLHAATVAGVGDTISGLTPSYLHYDSAVVGEPLGDPAIPERMARIFIGGEAEIFNTIKQRSLCIINDTYEFNYDRQPSEGVMHYFRRPTRISLAVASINADFDDWIYKDVICNMAAQIVAVKGLPNIREIFKQRGFYEALGVNPPFAQLFLNNVEVTIMGRPNDEQSNQKSG
jgi:hypothetical protein